MPQDLRSKCCRARRWDGLPEQLQSLYRGLCDHRTVAHLGRRLLCKVERNVTHFGGLDGLDTPDVADEVVCGRVAWKGAKGPLCTRLINQCLFHTKMIARAYRDFRSLRHDDEIVIGAGENEAVVADVRQPEGVDRRWSSLSILGLLFLREALRWSLYRRRYAHVRR